MARLKLPPRASEGTKQAGAVSFEAAPIQRERLGRLPSLVLLAPRNGRLAGVREVGERGLCGDLKGGLHAVELVDVAQLELHRLGAVEAHGEEREAVLRHLVLAIGLAVLRVRVPGLPEIRDTLRRVGLEDVVHVHKHMVMALPEEARHVAAGGEHTAIASVDDGGLDEGNGAAIDVDGASYLRIKTTPAIRRPTPITRGRSTDR